MLGKRLKQLREEKGLTQEQLAALVNLSQQTVGHYEVDRAEPSAKTLELLARIFATSTDFILGRSNNRYPTDINISETTSSYEIQIKQARFELQNNLLLADLPKEAKQSILEYIDFIRGKYL